MLAVMCGFSGLTGADLTLKNGSVYRNYRIKSVENGQAVVVFTLPDGSPDMAAVPVSYLPDEIQKQYSVQNWQSCKNMTDKVAAAAVQLKNSLGLLAAGDIRGREALAGTMKYELEKSAAEYKVSGNFEVVKNYSNGVLVRVLSSSNSSLLKKDSLIFVGGFQPVFQIFSETLYHSGTLVKLEQYGNVEIWNTSVKSAGLQAMEYIAGFAGDKNLAKAKAVKSLPAAAAAPAVSTAPVNTPAVESLPVPDMYYLLDDNDLARNVYVVDRQPRRYRVKNSCGKVFYIDQDEYEKLCDKGLIKNPLKPNRNPGRPSKPVKPNRPRPEKPERPELQDKPLFQRREGPRPNNGILPDSYAPGNVNIKTKLPRW